MIVALVALALVLTLALERAELAARAHPPLAPALPYDDALAYRGADDSSLDLSGVSAPEPIRIRRGQTVAGLLSELGLEPGQGSLVALALGPSGCKSISSRPWGLGSPSTIRSPAAT